MPATASWRDKFELGATMALTVGQVGLHVLGNLVESIGDELAQGALAAGIIYYHGMALAADTLVLQSAFACSDWTGTQAPRPSARSSRSMTVPRGPRWEPASSSHWPTPVSLSLSAPTAPPLPSRPLISTGSRSLLTRKRAVLQKAFPFVHAFCKRFPALWGELRSVSGACPRNL